MSNNLQLTSGHTSCDPLTVSSLNAFQELLGPKLISQTFNFLLGFFRTAQRLVIRWAVLERNLKLNCKFKSVDFCGPTDQIEKFSLWNCRIILTFCLHTFSSSDTLSASLRSLQDQASFPSRTLSNEPVTEKPWKFFESSGNQIEINSKQSTRIESRP